MRFHKHEAGGRMGLYGHDAESLSHGIFKFLQIHTVPPRTRRDGSVVLLANCSVHQVAEVVSGLNATDRTIPQAIQFRHVVADSQYETGPYPALARGITQVSLTYPEQSEVVTYGGILRKHGLEAMRIWKHTVPLPSDGELPVLGYDMDPADTLRLGLLNESSLLPPLREHIAESEVALLSKLSHLR